MIFEFNLEQEVEAYEAKKAKLRIAFVNKLTKMFGNRTKRVEAINTSVQTLQEEKAVVEESLAKIENVLNNVQQENK